MLGIEESVACYSVPDYCLNSPGLEFGDHLEEDAMKHVLMYLERRKSRMIRGLHVINGELPDFCLCSVSWLGRCGAGFFTYYKTGDEKIEAVVDGL